ncbi:MAG: PepSY domain-containing protein, partial [Oscillospiraceae bacterium]|nr:PepSY domain-containing protein [Oscillospiraceae bacterium]
SNSSNSSNSGNTSTTTITAAEAKSIALAQVPGASSSNIREFETDYDDGRLQYEGKIIYNGMEYEFEIDGYSGAIRSWEAEPVD